jgi:hypothetical protein
MGSYMKKLIAETPQQRSFRDALRDGNEKKNPLDLPYKLKYSPWQSFKMHLTAWYMLLFPIIIIGLLVLVVLSFLR